MRVIITGGTGLIGRALTRSLVDDGHEVIVLTRNPAKAAGMPASAQPVQWDARSAAGWGHLADGADAIVNLAGAGIAGDGALPQRWTAARKQLLRDSRLNAAKAVVAAIAAAAQKPRLLVQASAVGYYEVHTDERAVTEASPPGAGFLPELCVEWEASSAGVTDYGTRLVVLRTGLVLSNEGGVLPRTALPFRLFVGGPMGSGRQWMPWIHMEDEVRAIRFLMAREEASGAYNLCAPEPVRNKAFGQAIGRALGRPAWLPLPAFALQLTLGELAHTLLTGQRALPERLLAAGFQFHHTDINQAMADLLIQMPGMSQSTG